MDGAMWINNYLGENEQQTNKRCCEFCNTEVPDNMARLFGCTHCGARYCSKEHKKADFRFHKMRCMNYNHHEASFPNTTYSFTGDPYVTQSGTLGQQLQTDSDNCIGTNFQTRAPSAPLVLPRSTKLTGTNMNQLSPVQTSQNSVSPQIVTLQSPQMQYGQAINTQRTSPVGSGDGFSYMPNPSPYQSNNQFFSTSAENLSPIQTSQAQPTQQSLPNFFNSPAPSDQMGTVQMNNYQATNDEITLEDALSFLDEQEAEQYTSPQQQQQQKQLSPLLNSNPTTSPASLISTGESRTQAAEEFTSEVRQKQALYDQLLLLDSNSSIPGQMLSVQGEPSSKESSSLSSSNINPNEQNSQKPSSSSSPKDMVDTNEEISARMLEHFGLLDESSDEAPSLKEEGIFTRYDLRDVAKYIVTSLYKNNYCIVDCLHGEAIARSMLEEVKEFHRENAFSEGRLSSSKGKEGTAKKNIREDLVVWTDGKGRKTIKKHMVRMDLLLKFCNKLTTQCEISSRTQAMVACYPGGGTGYKQHVDNPSKDGRCITTLYYLNPDWDVKNDGGILKLFPSGTDRKTVNVEPVFDRLLLFWSNRRTPHEVTPAFKVRYAITLWYFDEQERKEYINRYKEGKV